MKKIDLLLEKISKNDLVEFYIVKNNRREDVLNYFNITSKDLCMLLRAYDIHKDRKLSSKLNTSKRSHESYVLGGKKSSLTQKKSWDKKTSKEKATWAEKCRLSQINMSEEKKLQKKNNFIRTYSRIDDDRKKEINNKRSISCKKVWEKEETKIKYRNTWKKSHEEIKYRSIGENVIANKLTTLGIEFEYDFVDKRYPYKCDFYVKSLDLFIEYQGHPSHGRVPYDDSNEDSLREASKMYGKWFEIYTIKDVEKMNKSKDLNFIWLYPNATFEENVKINNNKNIEIIKTLL